MRKFLCSFATLILLLAPARAADWTGFYEKEELTYWKGEMATGIEENLQDVIWPKLTPEEKKALGKVTLLFPLENAGSLINFYSKPDQKESVIWMPISALRFFGHMSVAYAWLNRNGYSLDTVSDYLAMLNYQWSDQLKAKPHQPYELLGIPKNAKDDSHVANIVQNAFDTGVIFALGHELGHCYYHHPGYDGVSSEVARANEEQADQFALELMRRIGEAPLGAPILFTILAHLESHNEEGRPHLGTHPVTPERIRAIARALLAHSTDYSRTREDVPAREAKLRAVANEFEIIAASLADTGVQRLLKQKGQTATPATLRPRRFGKTKAEEKGAGDDSSVLFSGEYEGDWIDAKGISLPGDLTLKRHGNDVTGKFTFGVGTLTLTGIVQEKALTYNWQWGTDHFGKGIMTVGSNDDELTGTWGYTKATQSGGSWKLRRRR